MVHQNQNQNRNAGKSFKALAMIAFIQLAARQSTVRAFSIGNSRTNLARNVLQGVSSSSSSLQHPKQSSSFTNGSMLHMSTTDTAPALTDEEKAKLEEQIAAKGDEIRKLKEDNPDLTNKDESISSLVKELLELKGKLDPSSIKPKKKKQQQQKGKKQQQKGQK